MLPLGGPPRRPRRRLRWLAIVVLLLGAGGLTIALRDRVEPFDPKWVTVQATKTEPGISYRNERIARVPWSIHVITIDRSRKDLTFYAALARNKVLGVSMLADQVRSVPRDLGKAVAGVNGDFYERDNRTYAGDPRGLQIVNGELVSAPHTVAVWFDNKDNPHLDEVKADFKITLPDGRKVRFDLNQQRRSDMVMLYTPTYGPSTRARGGRDIILEKDGNGPWLPLQAGEKYRARVREVTRTEDTPLPDDAMVLSIGSQVAGNFPKIEAGDVMEVYAGTSPDLKGVKTAIGGGPELIKNGKSFGQRSAPFGTGGGFSERSKYDRHPRSAIGWNATNIYLVTVDGRQESSAGMKLAELADYLVKLGCTDAMNLDGGKSAQLWMSGSVINNPCQGEDTVANSLWVVRKPTL
jgi:hypothetical protein